jgi:hypothetical protein
MWFQQNFGNTSNLSADSEMQNIYIYICFPVGENMYNFEKYNKTYKRAQDSRCGIL